MHKLYTGNDAPSIFYSPEKIDMFLSWLWNVERLLRLHRDSLITGFKGCLFMLSVYISIINVIFSFFSVKLNKISKAENHIESRSVWECVCVCVCVCVCQHLLLSGCLNNCKLWKLKWVSWWLLVWHVERNAGTYPENTKKKRGLFIFCLEMKTIPEQEEEEEEKHSCCWQRREDILE